MVEVVKRQTLKWFGHMERMEEGEMTRRVYKKWFGHMEQMEEGEMTRRVYTSAIEGGSVKGRPPVG